MNPSKSFRIVMLLVSMALSAYLFMATPLAAEPEKSSSDSTAAPSSETSEINITSDTLISDRDSRYAEFQGNVVATQEGSVLTSHRLKISFIETEQTETDKTEKNSAKASGSIDTITATGKVKMVMEDKTAWAEKAVFDRIHGTVTLTGGNPRVESGKSSITGETIVINRNTGKVIAHRGKNQPVNVIIYQEDLDKKEN